MYCRFFKDYTKVSRPLLTMTSAKVADHLPEVTKEQLASFEALQRRLISTPILALPRREDRWIVFNDASKDNLGVVLLRDQPDKLLKPAGFWRRGLTPAEKNYSTTERECLAVVWSLFLIRPYLKGTRFMARKDHTALKWMLHMDSTHGWLSRRCLRLAQYEYLVETRAGAAHNGPDCMSCLDTPAKDTSAIPDAIPFLALPTSGSAWVSPHPRFDQEYTPLMLEQLVKAQSTYPRCLELRKEIDTRCSGIRCFWQDTGYIRIYPDISGRILERT